MFEFPVDQEPFLPSLCAVRFFFVAIVFAFCSFEKLSFFVVLYAWHCADWLRGEREIREGRRSVVLLGTLKRKIVKQKKQEAEEDRRQETKKNIRKEQEKKITGKT